MKLDLQKLQEDEKSLTFVALSNFRENIVNHGNGILLDKYDSLIDHYRCKDAILHTSQESQDTFFAALIFFIVVIVAPWAYGVYKFFQLAIG